MSQIKFKTLVVDDHESVIETVKIVLGSQVEIIGASSAETAMDMIQTNKFDIVISDYDLDSDVTGVAIFKEARKRNPFVTACLMSANDAAPIMKEMLEAFGGIFIEKPFSEDSFQYMLEQAKRNHQRRLEIAPQTMEQGSAKGLIAETPSMIRLLNTIQSASKLQSLSIHMAGPTGTGKSTLAELIHDLSGVKGPLVTVNCSGLEELAMSRLFGHKKGSFTGATQDHDGYVKQANGGTLFLDELHLLKKDVQGKLLQVLQDGKYQPIGDTVVRTSHFRLVTAASVDIRGLVSEEKFTRDLWFRISGKVLNVPSLSERKACIPRIVYQRLREISEETGRPYEVEAQAMDLLVSFSWEGNIRDLMNSLKSLCSDVDTSGVITAPMVREELSYRGGYFPDEHWKMPHGEDFEKACRGYATSLITKALRNNQNNITRAARTLGIPRTTLINKMSAFGMSI